MGVVPILTFPDPILTVVHPLSHAFSVSSTLLAFFENKVGLASLFFDAVSPASFGAGDKQRRSQLARPMKVPQGEGLIISFQKDLNFHLGLP